MSEPRKLSQKLKIWFSEYWNISDFIGILLFLVGLSLRWYPDPYRRAGRICYCLDIIFWFVRVMDLLAVNQHAGPYLTMITKMVRCWCRVCIVGLVFFFFFLTKWSLFTSCALPDTQHVLHRGHDGNSAAQLRGVKEGHLVTIRGAVLEFGSRCGLSALLDDLWRSLCKRNRWWMLQCNFLLT